MTSPKRAVLLSILVMLVLAACVAERAPVLRLATTTSTYDSGLLQAIIPEYESANETRVDIIAVGTGQALALGRSGDADVLLVHALDQELAFVAEGHGLERIQVMYNDFVLLGPLDDPSGVLGTERASYAMKEIARTQSPFVSRGDSSGTHTKERALWDEAGLEPDPAIGWYHSIGQGMGETLLFTQELGAYTLADRGTFLAMRSRLPDLMVMVGGSSLAENADPSLLNPYGVIAVNPDRHPGVNGSSARQFIQWLVSLETQSRIAEYGREQFGQPLFYPDSHAWRSSGQ